MRRGITLGLAGLLLAGACSNGDDPPGATPPNVVLVIGDGFGVGAWGLGRAWAKARNSPRQRSALRRPGRCSRERASQVRMDW